MGMIDEDPIYVMGYNRGFKNGIKGLIPKDQYENRLKADMATMLKELQMEIKGLWDSRYDVWLNTQYYIGKNDMLEEVDEVIQQKIDALKGENNENN